MTTTRAQLGRWLRTLADRIDYAGAPKATHWSFTFEDGEGIRFREDGRGCRVWYLGDDDYAKAHDEADRGIWNPSVTGCCDGCAGTGVSGDPDVPGGLCWDCRGSGCAHADPCHSGQNRDDQAAPPAN